MIIESIFALTRPGPALLPGGHVPRTTRSSWARWSWARVLTLAGNLLADVGYGLADPRIRVGQGRGR